MTTTTIARSDRSVTSSRARYSHGVVHDTIITGLTPEGEPDGSIAAVIDSDTPDRRNEVRLSFVQVGFTAGRYYPSRHD